MGGGEIFALKWEHVDYFNRKLLVRQKILSNGSIGPPKTINSIRDVDLRPSVIETFKEQEALNGLMDSFAFLAHANKPY